MSQIAIPPHALSSITVILLLVGAGGGLTLVEKERFYISKL